MSGFCYEKNQWTKFLQGGTAPDLGVSASLFMGSQRSQGAPRATLVASNGTGQGTMLTVTFPM